MYSHAAIIREARLSALAVVEFLMQLERRPKRIIIFTVDAVMCIASTFLAFSLRMGALSFPPEPPLVFLAVALPLFVAAFLLTGAYSTIFRFAGGRTIWQLAKATFFYSLPLVAVFMIWGVEDVPRTVALLQPMILFGSVATMRVTLRYILMEIVLPGKFDGGISRVLIYGAGSSGQQLATSLRLEPSIVTLGFVDDDVRLAGQRLDGMPIYHSASLDAVAEAKQVDTLLLAIPHASRARRREIVESVKHLHLHVRVLPNIGEIAEGKVSVRDLREIQIEDLLGRDQVAPNELLLTRAIFGRTVFVTGAGGSIGSELCRHIAQIGATKLILFEQSEFALYAIERELRHRFPDLQLVPLLGSVQDRTRIGWAFQKWQPETVFHAAAYKHVPLVEANPIEGIRNNVLGTLIVVEEADKAGVRDMTLISTDKAVRPTNIMGATKRAAEQIVQAFAASNSETRFSIVRFGNVLGSSGSVVPLFRQQIEEGGPVTLTHRDVTRYFMTIPEAAQLVIQAGGLAKGGEVFVLDMGDPVRIADLARSMIELSGLSVRDEATPMGDIEIVEVGLRPGEKLYEELLIGNDPKPTTHPLILKAHEDFIPLARLRKLVEQFATVRDRVRAVALLKEVVPELSHRRDSDEIQLAS